LTSAGFPQFVAGNREGFIELAVEWAGRLLELESIRAEMRERVRQSPLCDSRQFARDFLRVVQEAWSLMMEETRSR
jgi:protein O-GlcNAc transferase